MNMSGVRPQASLWRHVWKYYYKNVPCVASTLHDQISKDISHVRQARERIQGVSSRLAEGYFF